MPAQAPKQTKKLPAKGHALATAIVGSFLALFVSPFYTNANAAVFSGAGFDTQLEPEYKPRPWVDIPADTTSVSEHAQREAQLSCFETSPVFRACNCDILSWDSCGNIYGKSAEITDWSVTVTHMATNTVSRLVSPIMWLKEGVARFYFTPTVIGPYTVTVTRSPTSILPALMTGTVMNSTVLVHDVTATCSQRTLGTMLPTFQDLLWAHSQHLNDQRKEIALEEYNAPTSINIDRWSIYGTKDGVLQQDIRRNAIQPFAPNAVIPRQPVEDNNMHMCDMVRHTGQ